MDIIEFMDSSICRVLTESICQRTESTIFPKYGEVFMNATQRQIDAANTTIETLVNTVCEDLVLFERFTVESILSSRGHPVEQAYNEATDKNETAWKVKKELGVAKDFLIPHMIDFWFLRKNSSEFENYLKITRTPNPKKHALKQKKLIELASKQT